MTYTEYIISYLLHHNPQLVSLVGYGAFCLGNSEYKVVILPSSFFCDTTYGEPTSMPTLPLKQLGNTPLLYGEPLIEQQNGQVVVHADIIASSFFLMSRYEEMVFSNSNRDNHGRFIGRHSLAYRAGFIDRPIVDEYGVLLRGWLRQAGVVVEEPQERYSSIVLTHDVDTLSHYRRWRGTLGALKRMVSGSGERISDVFRAWQHIEFDPAYTFGWLIGQDKLVDDAQILFFFKAAQKRSKYDYPQYHLYGKDCQRLLRMCELTQCDIGLHCSYLSGAEPKLIKEERKRLQKASQQKIYTARHHYLRALQPEDMHALIAAKIEDDYTMGYADVAGFRLGCCRPLLWIDPKSREVTSLTLHPLTAMDASLVRKEYMNLTPLAAYHAVIELLKQVQKHAGEVVLLWHNTSVQEHTNAEMRKVYQDIIQYLKS